MKKQNVKRVDRNKAFTLSDFVEGVLNTPDSVVLRMKDMSDRTKDKDKMSDFLSAGYLCGDIRYIRVNKGPDGGQTFTLIFRDGTFEIWNEGEPGPEYRKHFEEDIRRCIEDELSISTKDRR